MTSEHQRPSSDSDIEQVDVVIVGAGLSGIAAAYYLQQDVPDKRYLVLDALESYGGTWLTHRYPGARSDSDLFTFGFAFKPWKGDPIASRDQILSYLGETISENRLDRHIRYRHEIVSAEWDSEDALWTLTVRVDGTSIRRVRCGFLWMCQGYYRHAKGFTPAWKHTERFQGQIVHPQHWPESLDYRDKRVVVIGSGATAATLVPAIAADCAHVTLLQRTPTYFATGRNADTLADELRRLQIDDRWIHEIIRRKVVHDRDAVLRRARAEPEVLKRELLEQVRRALGPDYDIGTHFTPPYRPHQQRVCFVPDGDLFKAIAKGQATVVTDRIDEFTPTGIRLASGAHLEADIVVTATGFELSFLGDIGFAVDGEPVDFARTITYRGIMFTGVPNLAWTYGYNRYSWTLRAEIVARFVTGLLGHMDRTGAHAVSTELRETDQDMAISDWVDPENFNPGYLLRGRHLLPRRGDKPEWRHTQDYLTESRDMQVIDYDDALFTYRHAFAAA